jgi:hypothetical protein
MQSVSMAFNLLGSQRMDFTQLPVEQEKMAAELATLAVTSGPLLVSTPDETLGLGSDHCNFYFHIWSGRPELQHASCSGEKRPRTHA